MENKPCHSMGKEVSLSPVFNRLKQEHVSLREQVEPLFQLAQTIGVDQSISDWRDALNVLREESVDFQKQVDFHSQREEDFVFPVIANYIGRETGPIAVMEYEHEMAKKILESFMTETEQMTEAVSAEKAKEIAVLIADACNILSEHFMKEENVLFPMGERLLSDEEKDCLEKMIRTI